MDSDSVEKEIHNALRAVIERHPKLAALVDAKSADEVPEDERPDMAEYVAILLDLGEAVGGSLLKLAAEIDTLKAGQDDASR